MRHTVKHIQELLERGECPTTQGSQDVRTEESSRIKPIFFYKIPILPKSSNE